jgi:hypothetical protein
MACIYRLLFPNGKSYIGYCKHDHPISRYKAHNRNSKNISSTRKINQAIALFGFNNIHKQILEIHQDEEYALRVLENQYINKYNSIKDGYNSIVGGGKRPILNGKSNPGYSRKGRKMEEWFTADQIKAHKNAMSLRHSGKNNTHARKYIIMDHEGNKHCVEGNLVEFCNHRGLSFPLIYHYIDKGPIPPVSSKARFKTNNLLLKRQKAIGMTITRND